MKKIKLLVIMLLGCYSISYSNGLTLSNISVNQAAGTVSFNVRWYNSWRVGGEPKNWDAVWIFVKFRLCSAPTTVEFTHGLVDSDTTQHTFNNLSPVKSNGVAGIDSDRKGVLLRRESAGVYSSPSATNIVLKLTNLPATGDLDVRVFGIEMVYVPEGSFYLGDGTTTITDAQFKTSSTNTDPILVTSENTLSVYTEGSATNSTYPFYAISGRDTIPAVFPKGYAAFHIMKYEITEQQYADFLNTIPSQHWGVRYLGNYGSYRNRLINGGTYPNFYYTTRPYRAQNYLSWADITAFLDWACLSPMSECQYEKACRGPQPFITGEYAWGNIYITAANNINNTIEDGTEVVGTGNCNYNNTTLVGGDEGQGPLRVGIFATATTTTREATGASYYGVMELSGNVAEWCVMAVPNNGPNPTAFQYQQWGDGYLDQNGDADVTGWPSSKGSPTYSTDKRVIIRGGCWNYNATRAQVSNRDFALLTNANWPATIFDATSNFTPTLRSANIGGRGIR